MMSTKRKGTSVRLPTPDVDELDPYQFFAELGKKVIHRVRRSG